VANKRGNELALSYVVFPTTVELSACLSTYSLIQFGVDLGLFIQKVASEIAKCRQLVLQSFGSWRSIEVSPAEFHVSARLEELSECEKELELYVLLRIRVKLRGYLVDVNVGWIEDIVAYDKIFLRFASAERQLSKAKEREK
jgi:hypothetical protein